MPFKHIQLREKSTLNKQFRRSLYKSKNMELTVMNIPVDGDIGMEVHRDEDQFIRIEKGKAIVQINKKNSKNYDVKTGDAVVIPQGKWHNIINTGSVPLKLSVIYAPSEDDHSH